MSIYSNLCLLSLSSPSPLTSESDPGTNTCWWHPSGNGQRKMCSKYDTARAVTDVVCWAAETIKELAAADPPPSDAPDPLPVLRVLHVLRVPWFDVWGAGTWMTV